MRIVSAVVAALLLFSGVASATPSRGVTGTILAQWTHYTSYLSATGNCRVPQSALIPADGGQAQPMSTGPAVPLGWTTDGRAIVFRPAGSSSGRDPWFDNAKMALVTLVVIGHGWTLLPLDSFDGHLYDFLYSWHIPAFVLVTGSQKDQHRVLARQLDRVLDRQLDQLVAVIAVVALRPGMLFSVGMQLSVAATAGIVVFCWSVVRNASAKHFEVLFPA